MSLHIRRNGIHLHASPMSDPSSLWTSSLIVFNQLKYANKQQMTIRLPALVNQRNNRIDTNGTSDYPTESNLIESNLLIPYAWYLCMDIWHIIIIIRKFCVHIWLMYGIFVVLLRGRQYGKWTFCSNHNARTNQKHTNTHTSHIHVICHNCVSIKHV